MWARSAAVWCVLGALLAACSEPAPAAAERHARADAGAEGCAPGEETLADGSCRPAGVPVDACGAGFAPDDAGGCEPILPAEPCPPGQLALLGEATCHEVAPCPDGRWGEIPTDASTQYVDAAFDAKGSNGSPTKPWRTIGEAVDAAQAGAVIAVAAGSYAENVEIGGRPVRLWGVCPRRVEIVGSLVAPAALVVLSHAGGTEIHDLAITGATRGFGLVGSEDVVVDRVWIHDTKGSGVHLEASLGASSVQIANSLVEAAKQTAVTGQDSSITLVDSVLRDTVPGALGAAGGVSMRTTGPNAARGTLALRRVIVDRPTVTGVFGWGADVLVEDSLVRGTLSDGDGKYGWGVAVMKNQDLGIPASLELRGSLVDGNRQIGLTAFAARVHVESTVVRGTLPAAGDQSGGRGIDADFDPLHPEDRGSLQVHASLVTDNRESGITLIGTDAELVATIVRNTVADATGARGVGVSVQTWLDPFTASTATIRACVLEGNEEVGVAAFGSELTLERSVVRDSRPHADGGLGFGVALVPDFDTHAPSTGTIRSSWVSGNRAVGVLVSGSHATVEDTRVIGTLPSANTGLDGDGIAVVAFIESPESTLELRGSRVEGSARAGLSTFGGAVTIGSSVFECNPIDLDGEVNFGYEPSLDDVGGNACGCAGSAHDCKVLSASLSAPDQLEPPDPPR